VALKMAHIHLFRSRVRKFKSVSDAPFAVVNTMPQLIAIIMYVARLWAKQFGMLAALCHARGAQSVRSVVQAYADRGVRYLTLFAFSTENWQRPAAKVSALMGLLTLHLQKEVKDMNPLGVCFKVAGGTSGFDARIQALIRNAQDNTAHNDNITVTIADLVQAFKAWQLAHPAQSVDALDEASLTEHLGLAYAPDPDLLIRTGGESRISNFMLWQMAYTELFFTDVLWPSFSGRYAGLGHRLVWRTGPPLWWRQHALGTQGLTF
jgi:undecaprenyl diphosphate synthase